MPDGLKTILREPLVHFFGAGLLIFLLLGWGGSNVDPASRTIIIGEAKVEQLATGFAGVWKRPPSPEEIDGLIRDYIREEIYYREAKRLGLDEDDPIIRRRLRGKMEEIATATAESAEPDDAALQALVDANPAKYADGGQISFQHIWLGEDGDATTALQQLNSGGNPEKIGKSISLPTSLTAASGEEIDRIFGTDFAGRLNKAKIGEWNGPVLSGFGLHLVKIDKRVAGKLPALADIRQKVENDWRSQNVTKRKESSYQALLDGYDIKIEKPQ